MHRPNQSPDAKSRLPWSLHPPAQPVTRLRVTPYYAPIGCVGDRVFELPRSTILRLLPATDLRGDSNLASFSAAGCEVPSCPVPSRFLLRLPMLAAGCPARCTFRLYRRPILEASRGSDTSAVPIERFRVAPYCDPSVSPTTRFRVAPEPVSSGTS